MLNQEKVALTKLPRELVTLTGTSPSYRQLWCLTVDGIIPAEQVNGRWHVARADVPAIATMLGLPVPIAT
jgi:hypothetical protein